MKPSEIESRGSRTAESGWIMYDHIRETRPAQVSSLVARTVCGAYIAAVMRENGFGRLLSVNIDSADYDPGPVRLLDGLDLDEFVELRRVPDSSYDWLLREQIRAIPTPRRLPADLRLRLHRQRA